ncbi:MAG TPA: amidohydrolase family protein [Armatimonadota bacterium]|jgi:hypothetical protein
MDVHVHLLGDAALDAEFLAFAREWQMKFATSCLGPYGDMIPVPTYDECVKSNDLVLAQIEACPDLAYGFCYVNPQHGQQAINEIRRCVRDGGMRGIKLWIACKCSDSQVFPIAEEAISLGVPILQHSYIRLEEMFPGESVPADVAVLAERYPELRIIMAHMGLNWRVGVSAIRDYQNVFVDTCGFDPEIGSVEYAADALGEDRVLYGSDAPGRDILCQMGKVMAADISESCRRKILLGNAEKLLGIEGSDNR